MVEGVTVLDYRSGEVGVYLSEIVLNVSRLIESDWTIVTLSKGEMGQVIASSREMEWDNAGFSLHGTLAAEVVQSGRSRMVQDSRKELPCYTIADQYYCYLGVPLRTTSQAVIGTICSFLQEPRLFTDSEIKIVESFAERAATAIENYQLYQQQLQFNRQLSQQVAACSLDLQRSQERLIERERLAAIGEFTSIIVHEVRNPLATIELGLRHAKKVVQADADQERIALALSETHRLNHLLDEILSYARPPVLHRSRLNLNEFLRHLLVQLQALPEASDRPLLYEQGGDEIAVMADPDKLKQVFLNLFRNAFEAIDPGEPVRCWLQQEECIDRVDICIHNGGKPIPPEVLPQLATPFCSTKPSGTGLGLAISKRIIVAHEGELAIASSSSGTTVTVSLPLLLDSV